LDLQRLRVESFQCRNHPEREGVGICVACRRVFCVECSTKIDGVNHCRECLAKRQKTAQASAARRSGFLVRGFELLFSTAVVAGSVCLLFGIFMLLGESHKSGGHVANKDRMEAVSRALRAYRRDTGSFPTDQEGLEALARKPDAATGWQGPYVDPSLLDARGNVVDTFGSPVRYRAPRKGETACVVGSPGGDRVLQTDLDKVQPLKVSPNGEGAGEGDDLIIFVD
jgi:type II secretory pathway pseudopilin PulG